MDAPRRLRAALIATPLLLLGLTVTPPAHAAGSVTLPAVADTFVNGGSVNNSFGTQTTMRVDDGNPKIAYVEFTVSGIPTGAPVTSATLRLFGTSGDPVAVDVHTVNPAAWSESTTYNTRPALGAKIATVTLDAGANTVSIPVSGNGVVSLALARDSAGIDTILATREDTTASQRPSLVVNYGDVPAPPVACNDGADNDGDTKVDYPADPGCSSATDTDETDPVTPPPPPPTGGYDVLGVTEAYVDSLPTNTAAWAELVAMADAPYTVDHLDGALDGSGNAVAGALVYVRTGNAAYKTKVEAALNTIQSIPAGNWQHAAANRKLGGWVAAAQLIGKPARNADGSLNAWGALLQQHLSVVHAGAGGGPSRSEVMLRAARGWDNNHGAAARQSVAAIEAYLDLPLTTSCNAMKAWLGGTHAAYTFVPTTSESAPDMGWSPDAASWYDPQHYAGINPSAAWAGHAVPALKDGAIPSDVHRDGGIYPNIGSNGADHYIYGNLYREVAAMTTLAANGCTLWGYADSAMKRARVWALTNIPEQQNDYLGNADPLLRAVYGVGSTTEDVGTGENFLVASEWLAGSTWPVR